MDFPIDIGSYVNLKLNGKEKLSKNIKSFGMPNASSNIADFAEEVID